MRTDNIYRKSATIDEFTIGVCPNGSIDVLIYGRPFHGNVKGLLRGEIAERLNFCVDSGWSTQQLGSKLVDFINKESATLELKSERGTRMVARTIYDCSCSKRQSKRESVKKLRDNMSVVDNCPGYYIWWFNESCVKKLLAPLDSLIGVRWDDIIHDEKGYAALYIGITKKRGLRERFSDHIKGNRGSSTLRLTLCALFGIGKAQSEDAIDDFMDQYCEWEWICTDAEEAETIENDELSTNYYPLNIAGNTSLSPSDKGEFRNFRNQYKNID